MFEIQIVQKVRWWKRPYYWIRRWPTSQTHSFTDAEIIGIEFFPDGSVKYEMEGVDGMTGGAVLYHPEHG